VLRSSKSYVKPISCVTGAWAELVAAEILLSLGFEVFRNLAPKGEHDLVILWAATAQCLPVDVTLGTWHLRNNGSKRLDSTARTKLHTGRKQGVLIVTDVRELFLADLDESQVVYEGKHPFALKLTEFTLGEFLRRVS
jgi:hypothetical protein